MSVFSAELYDNAQRVVLTGLCSWRAQDASGSFTLLPHHCRFMTITEAGLTRFTQQNDAAQQHTLYLACTPALVEFTNNTLYLTTRRFFINPDAALIQQQLAEWLAGESARRLRHRGQAQHLDNELLHRLQQTLQQTLQR